MSATSPSPACASPRESGGTWSLWRDGRLWGLALLALLLRALEAAESSLWLDELHTLSHASQKSLGAVADAVASEYHTPLFFGFVHLFGGFELGAWLRAIPILSSVAMLFLVAEVARQCGLGRRSTLVAACLFACLPYQVLYGSELRPYAWIGALSVVAFLLSFAESRSVTARLAWFALAVLLGLMTHRLMAFGVFSLGCARLFARKPGSVPLWGLVLSGTLAVGAFLPWFFEFAKAATDRRFEHQAATGGYQLRATLVNELVSLPSRLVTPYMRELGGVWGTLELASTGGFLLLAAALLFLAWRASRSGAQAQPAAPVLRGLWIFALVQFLTTTAFSWYTWDRVPLQYYTPMAWVLCVLAGALLDRIPSPAASRALTWALCAAGLVMGVALVGGRSREDMRGGLTAVRQLAAEARAAGGSEPVFSAVLAQPRQFPHTLPYRAYGAGLVPVEPESVPRRGEAGFSRPVIVLRRAVPLGDETWRPITEGRRVVKEVRVDRYLTAYWFAPEP
ncbi:MAG: hypothetical protein IPK67_03100 [Planctomycetes bacterium]|nr:hypothetical protein [Planctomycetota bacterium]